MSLDSTVGGVEANSYVTVVEASNYFSFHELEDSWNQITKKEAFLVRATRDLEKLNFKYSKNKKEQSLKFPRSKDVSDIGVAFIPNEVKNAVCEQALFRFLNEDLFIHQMNYQNGISDYVSGGNDFIYNKKPVAICIEATEFLKPFRLVSGRTYAPQRYYYYKTLC